MIGVRVTELGDCQRAARTLLVRGIVTESVPGPRDWRNVRRYAEPLDEAFRELAGYSVLVTRSAVRLVRRHDRLVDSAVFVTPSGRPFDRVRYALIALTLAALERSGSQTTLTDLARRIRRAAEKTAGLPFDPVTHTSRLALSHAVRELEKLGALTLTDGSREAWERGSDEAEALYDVHRTLCRQLFPLSQGMSGPEAHSLLHEDPVDVGRDPSRRARRKRLVRRILEQPVVYLCDLDESERAFLRKEARPIARDLEELTGARLERRREGVALIDPGRGFSDRPFPSGGADQQAALLLADRLCQELGSLPTVEAPHGDERSDQLSARIAVAQPSRDSGPVKPRSVRPRAEFPFVDDARLRREAETLCSELDEALKAPHRESSLVFLRDALRVLAEHDLVRPVSGGVALMPALARFGEVAVEASPELRAQLGLFGGRA